MEKNKIINRHYGNSGEQFCSGYGFNPVTLDWEMTFNVVDDAIWILSHEQKVLMANKNNQGGSG